MLNFMIWTISFGKETVLATVFETRRALLRRSKDKKDKNVNTNNINFTLIESTKGSKNKEHNYLGKRIKLNEPITYQTKNGINVEKKYKNELKKIKKSDS